MQKGNSLTYLTDFYTSIRELGVITVRDLFEDAA
jgi:hypothetical protein